LRIATGLPVSFYTDKDSVRERLLGEHVVQRGGRSAQALKVTDCRVIPQPFGSLLSLALDDQGRIVDNGLATGVVDVVDVVSKAINLLSVNRLSEIRRETSSVSVDAWSVARAVRTYIADNCPDLDMRAMHVIDGRNGGGYECRRKDAMTTHELSIKYSDDLLLALKKARRNSRPRRDCCWR